MELINTIIGYADELPAWLNAITALVVALSGITALTPTKSDNKAVDVLLKLVNFLALNIGKNKNADAE